MRKIFYNQRIEGIKIPGIIYNSHYYYSSFSLYEDGGIYCWNLYNLNKFKEKLESEKLLTCIPIGKNINIHGLGIYKIYDAVWLHTKETYYELFFNKLHEISVIPNNPYITELINKNTKRKISQIRNGEDFLVSNENFYKTVNGDSIQVFMHINDKIELVDIVVYKNEEVIIYTEEKDIVTTINKIEILFKDGTFISNFENQTWVKIPILGEILIIDDYYEKVYNKFLELREKYDLLNEKETPMILCQKYYIEYLKSPNDFYRQKMKEYYEQIPEHERIYLGDMDSKDSDYQRIIYFPDEKREV